MDARRVGSLRWYGVLLVRVAGLVLTAAVLQTAAAAAWDDHVLGVRGQLDRATVVAVRHTAPGRADKVEVDTARFGGPVRVITPRKNLGVGEAVDVVVDPLDPARAALAGDGWPWRQIVLPLTGLLVVAVLVGRYGRWPEPEPPADTDELVRGGAT
ncbi:hypothetical protein LWC35_37995 [Pseudonocardia kujensis]|uniref:hypothetical protein n=1 Tax=Pseudonocardia kujensis TaxID=1128675 RepID=UPI001E5B7C3A|nr:hypothetical protein [Pseudonocardia kujensis]MCE0768646.1 hypothetical protein [Pseudonocardia kujensis]